MQIVKHIKSVEKTALPYVPDVLDIDPYYREKTVAIALSSVTGVAIAIVVAYYLYRKLSEPKCDNVDEVAFLEAVSARGGGSGLGSDGVGAFDGSDLQLDFLLTSGRFGEVYSPNSLTSKLIT